MSTGLYPSSPSGVPPITYEQMMEMFRQTRLQFQETDKKFQETDKKFQETDKKFQETDKKFQETDRQLSKFGDRIGELVATLVEGGILRQFRKLGYEFTRCARRMEFKNHELDIYGEIDLYLENGDYVLAVEVKVKLNISDVNEQIKRMEKYRRYLDARGESCKILAAIGGGLVPENVQIYARRKGLFVVVQTGDSVEVLAPKGKQPKTW